MDKLVERAQMIMYYEGLSWEDAIDAAREECWGDRYYDMEGEDDE